MTDREIQQFIIKYFLSDPTLKPPTPVRYYMVASACVDIESIGGAAKVPASHRVQLAFRLLKKQGWLAPGCDPDVFFLSDEMVAAFQAKVVKSEADLFGVTPVQAKGLKLYNLVAL